MNPFKDKNHVLTLNMPSNPPVMRRYNCTYRSSGFLYPPQELLRAATVFKRYSDFRVTFIDAVAEKIKFDEILKYIDDNNVNILFTLMGLEKAEFEISMLRKIKERVPSLKIIGAGYYVVRYRKYFNIFDASLDGAFEARIKKALEMKGAFLDNLKEIELKNISHDPDIIDSVDRSFLKEKFYSDIFVKGPTAWLFYAFGCPFKCSYCLRTYDSKKWLPRSFEKVFDELKILYENGYENIRFLDDNITLDQNFLKELYNFLDKNGISFNFYGFSRTDLINDKTADLLKSLNFRRLYLGVETFSSAKQKEYGKDLDTSAILNEAFSLLRKRNIETAAWIIYDPNTDSLFSLARAAWRLSRLKSSAVLMNILVPYPGTRLYEARFGKWSGKGFSVKMAGGLNSLAAALLFYGSYALYVPNWPGLTKYITCYPGIFIKAVFKDVLSAAGIIALPGRRYSNTGF